MPSEEIIYYYCHFYVSYGCRSWQESIIDFMKQEEKPKLGTKKFVIFIYTKKETNQQPPLEGEEKKFKTLSKNTKLGHLSSTTFFL